MFFRISSPFCHCDCDCIPTYCFQCLSVWNVNDLTLEQVTNILRSLAKLNHINGNYIDAYIDRFDSTAVLKQLVTTSSLKRGNSSYYNMLITSKYFCFRFWQSVERMTLSMFGKGSL